MGRADIRSAENAACSSESETLKLSRDHREGGFDRAADVLPERERGLALFDDASLLFPEAGLLAFETSATAGDGEILAGAAASDEIHQAAPAAAVEGAHVRPDRSFAQGSVCHSSSKHGSAERIRLDVRHCSSAARELKPEVEAADAAEERQEAGRCSHIHGSSQDCSPFVTWYGDT